MSAGTRVSVVIIYRNTERFLDEAIESVVRQTLRDWELLLVDDGSWDRSGSIGREWAVRHPGRIRCLEHPHRENRGMSASRNLGLRHARGPYVAFLDADDVLFPDALEQQVAVLEAHREAAMVYGPIQWWYSWTDTREGGPQDYVAPTLVKPGTLVTPPKLLARMLKGRARIHSGLVVRADVARAVGGFEEEFRGLWEDKAFTAKICLRHAVYVSGRCFYRYRRHAESCTAVASRRGAHPLAHQRFLRWLGEYFDREGVRTWSLRWALCRAWLPYRHSLLYRFLRGGKRLVSWPSG